MPSFRSWPLALALALASTGALSASPSTRLRLATSDPRATAARLAADGFDVVYADARQNAVEIVGDDADAARLRALGYDPQPLPAAAPEALSDYLTPAEVESLLAQYESEHPTLARRIAYATDHQGRTAWALKISDNVSQEEDEPAILFVAQHHAREVMTTEVAIDTIEQLLGGYGTDPEITRWVDGAEIFVIPAHNPDGASYVFTNDANWRKNRRDNGDGSFGVDLNRNYPFDWGACGGSSDVTTDDLYRGPSAGSEPTTAGLMALARQQRPVYYISYHTYGSYALHPYGCSSATIQAPDFRTLRELTNEVSALLDSDTPGRWFEFGTPSEVLYGVDGDTDSWFYGELGSFGVTFELNDGVSGGFQPDYATWRDSTVERARPGWRYYLSRLDGPRISGHVTDACSGLALPGTAIALAEQAFVHGETPRAAAGDFARFDWPVLPGSYTLQASRSGYAAQSWPATVGFAPLDRPIALVPDTRRGAAVSGMRVADPDGDGDAQADPGETLDLYLTAYATGAAVGSLTATVTSSDPSVTVLDGSAAFGSLTAGERREATDAVRIALAPGAPDDQPVTLRVQFAASAGLCAAVSAVTLRVTTGQPGVAAATEQLDANPFWTIDNSIPIGGWEFGPPVAGVSGAPPSAFTGQNVYATNLAGNYADNAQYALTAGPFDLTGTRHAELRFARWLVAEPAFDLARVEVKSGANGTWQTVWKGFGRDTAWVPLRYDISALADGSPALFVRFSLASDARNPRPGFYLDDLSIVGERIPIPGAHVGYTAVAVDDSDAAYANANGRLDAGETARLVLTVTNHGTEPARAVSGVVNAVSPGVVVHDPVVDFPDLAPGASAASLAPHASVTTSGACGESITLRLTSRWSDGGTREETFVVPVGQTIDDTLLQDDFEADRGWLPGGSASSGAFVRADPNGCTSASLGPIRPENDTTPAPGRLCWITGNPAPSTSCPPNGGDVTNGTVWVRSPRFDAPAGGRLLLDFSRWLTLTGRSFGGTLEYRAEASADDGLNWTTVDVSSGNFAAWSRVHLEMTGFVPPSPQTRIRFVAREQLGYGTASTVLAVDDVKLVWRHGVCAAFAASETLPPNPVGNTLRAARRGDDVELTWTAPPADAGHDPARFFPVWRSATPQGGFAEAGDPTVPAWREAGAGAAAGGTAFYLVGARNAAGGSGEAAP